MTTLTHQLTPVAAGVSVTVRVYDGNKYADQVPDGGVSGRWSASAVSNAQGQLSWTVPDGIHMSTRGTLLQVRGISGNPVVRIRPGTVSTTVAAALVGNTDGEGQLASRAGTPDPVSQDELDETLATLLEAQKVAAVAAVKSSGAFVATPTFRSRQAQAGQLGDDWFDGTRLGIFCHYTWGGPDFPETRYRNGGIPSTLDALADDFDAETFAADVASFGVDYVIFTAWHYAMHVLYPSAVMDGKLTGHTSDRDVIADLIAALEPYGIRLVLYVHPIDGNDLTPGERTATGWNDSSNGYAAWQTFINDLLTECGERYGTAVDGFWVDMVQNPDDFAPRFGDIARLRRSLQAGHPRRVILGNQGTGDNITHPTRLFRGVADHLTREYIGPPASVNDWTAGLGNVAVIGTTGDWWALKPQGSGSALRAPAADLFRYTVLQAGVNQYGGGTAWAMSPYAGSGATSLWEDGVQDAMQALRAYVDPIRESLTDVSPSPSFPKPNTLTLANLGASGGFVATRSGDGLTEYVHVLNAPGAGASFDLPAPIDGAVFFEGRNVATGRAVDLRPISTGLRITLDPADQWSATDTVIALTRFTPTGERFWVGAFQWGSQNGAVYSTQAVAGRYAGYSLSPSTGMQIETTFAVPDHWNTFDIDFYWSQPVDGAGNAILSITHAVAAPGAALNVDDQTVGQTYTMPGTPALAVMSPFAPMRVTRGAINHIRLAREAEGGGDTGPTVVILGAMIRRLN